MYFFVVRKKLGKMSEISLASTNCRQLSYRFFKHSESPTTGLVSENIKKIVNVTVHVLIWLSALAVVISKYLDVWSTLRKLESPRDEKNPLAAYLMKKWGIKWTVWGIFALVIVIVAYALLYTLVIEDTPQVKCAFIIVATLISIVQASVVASNLSGRLNPVTRWLMTIYKMFR